MKFTLEIDLGDLSGPVPHKHGPITERAAYPYRDENGRELFQHLRRVYQCGEERHKEFPYRYRPHARSLWVWRKPRLLEAGYDADDYLWRLPQVLAAKQDRDEVWWTEGEKDATAVLRAGRCATSHHGGSGKVTLAQARWLVGVRRVVLCIDNDPHDTGYMDGALRWRRLVEQVGVKRGRVRVVRAAEGKDVADHLAAGYALEDMVRVGVDELLERGGNWDPQAAGWDGYGKAGMTIRMPNGEWVEL